MTSLHIMRVPIPLFLNQDATVEDEVVRNSKKMFPKMFKEAQDLQLPGGTKSAEAVTMTLGAFFQKLPKERIEVFSNPEVRAPWKIPRTLPQAALINTLLAESMTVQSSGFFKRTEFAKCIMSGESLTISGLIHIYLKNLGIPSNLNVGVLRMKREKEEGHLPLVWLTIHGTLIDNTYHYWPRNKAEVFDKEMVRAKRMEFYSEQDPTAPDLKLADCLGSTTCPQDPKLCKAFGNVKDIEKYIVFRACTPEVYPNMRLFSMGIAGVLSDLKYPVRSLPEKWEKLCWNCERKSAMLKSCTQCKEGMGMYCNVECQKADWESHKLLHKDLRANIRYWKAKAAAGRN